MPGWGPVTTREQGDPVWRHGLTDEERRLRDLAYPLIDPPYDRNKWYSFLGELSSAAAPGPIRTATNTPRGCSPSRTARRPRATTS